MASRGGDVLPLILCSDLLATWGYGQVLALLNFHLVDRGHDLATIGVLNATMLLSSLIRSRLTAYPGRHYWYPPRSHTTATIKSAPAAGGNCRHWLGPFVGCYFVNQ